MNPLASAHRSQQLATLSSSTFDLLIIGGGITGAGIALDAASRGLSVALVEMLDFASGTSSRSTKLIHGGLRYLKQFEIGLVRETGSERAVVHKLAPHLAAPEKMLLPLIEDGQFGKILTSFGLMVYDVLAGVEKPDQRVMLSQTETLAEEPQLKKDNLKGGGLYAEYRTDDARLTMSIIKTATQYGATCVNYVKAVGFEYDANNQLEAVTCEDMHTAENFSIRAKQVVSATGPWVDTLRKQDGSLSGKRLHLTKGVHIVVPYQRFPVKHSVYFDMPDGRMIFAIPRNRVTYIGTTDTDYTGDLSRVRTHLKDVQYLLDGVNRAFTGVDLQVEDVESSWAGLRPLIHEDGKSASELSRKDEIFISDRGLISIAGGKLTGYRKMAERIVDLVGKQMRQKTGRDIGPCKTETITLAGGDYAHYREVLAEVDRFTAEMTPLGLQEHDAYYIVHNYGTAAQEIWEAFLVREETDVNLRLLMAELVYTLEHESVYSAVDFLNRRTGRLYFHIESVKQYAQAVIDSLAKTLEWTPERKTQEKTLLQQAISDVTVFPTD